MFAVGGINFSNGAYYNGALNGAEVHLMQSSENADKVISDFERAFAAGLDPNNVIKQIMDNHNLSDSDFTEIDIARINRKIEQIYKAKQNRGY